MSYASSDFVGCYDIKGIPQGSDVSIPINYRTGDPIALVDLSTYSAKLQVRKDYNSPVLIDLSTADGSILVSATSPNLTLKFTPAKTVNMTVFDDLIYDLDITSSTGIITTILGGSFSISRQVTR